MEDVIPPETKALFESAARGDLEFLDLLVLSRPYAHLYYYLKEVHRLGRGPLFPPLHMFDLMQSQRLAVRAYNWGRFQTLIERLERLSGEELSERRFLRAIELTNAVRDLQRQLLELRWQAGSHGVDALRPWAPAISCRHRSIARPRDYLEPWTPRLDGPRLLIVTSEPLSHTDCTIAGVSGGLVVAEDDWWGSRATGRRRAAGGFGPRGNLPEILAGHRLIGRVSGGRPRSLAARACAAPRSRRCRVLPATFRPPARLGLPPPEHLVVQLW